MTRQQAEIVAASFAAPNGQAGMAGTHTLLGRALYTPHKGCITPGLNSRRKGGAQQQPIHSKTLRHWGFPCDPSTQY